MFNNKKRKLGFAVGIVSTFLISLSSAMAYVPAGNVGLTWKMLTFLKPYNSDVGLTNLTFRFTINKSTLRASGTYFAQQFYFNNTGTEGNAAYTGLQPQSDAGGKQYLRAVFSSFIANSTTTDRNCSLGADGGPGVSCGIVFPTTYGHTYAITVKKIANNTWSGDLKDEQSGQKIHIGSWTLPSQTGNLQAAGMGFAEYYAYYEPGYPQFVVPQCNKLAKIDVIYGSVTSTDFDGGLADISIQSFPYAPYEYNTNCTGTLSNFETWAIPDFPHVNSYVLQGYGYQVQRGWISQ